MDRRASIKECPHHGLSRLESPKNEAKSGKPARKTLFEQPAADDERATNATKIERKIHEKSTRNRRKIDEKSFEIRRKSSKNRSLGARALSGRSAVAPGRAQHVPRTRPERQVEAIWAPCWPSWAPSWFLEAPRSHFWTVRQPSGAAPRRSASTVGCSSDVHIEFYGLRCSKNHSICWTSPYLRDFTARRRFGV